MKNLDWRWIGFQIGVPAAAPILLSALFVFGWKSLTPTFAPDPRVIVDVTPWAIAVYSLALIGGTFDRSWSKLGKGGLSLLWMAAAANAIYYSFLVIRRHDPEFAVAADAYWVTLVLMVSSVVLCYRAR
jgi:hypothetical protein